MATLRSRVRETRARKGQSQQELAARAGLSRQALSAIEAGRSVPSAAIALRIARALASTVEELFALDPEISSVRFAGGPGRRLALAEINGRLVAHPLADGAAVAADALSRTRGRVELLRDDVRSSLLVLGCDPALALLAARAAERGVRVTWLHAPSAPALQSLARDETHLAGIHLRDNAAAGRDALPGAVLCGLARWELGFAVARGNPRKLRGAADLAGRGIRIVNREPGAGARGLLDRLLREAGVPTRRVRGYQRLEGSHDHVAHAVALGAADAGISTRRAAAAHGLGFVPLSEERFDLLLPAALLDDPRVGRVLDALHGEPFRREVAALPGYTAAPKEVTRL